MTKLDINAIRERVEKATEGPWKWQREWKEDGHHSGSMGCLKPDILWYGMDGEEGIYCPEKGNAEFIAHAREDIPALLDAVQKMSEALKKISKDGDGLWDGHFAAEVLLELGMYE